MVIQIIVYNVIRIIIYNKTIHVYQYVYKLNYSPVV